MIRSRARLLTRPASAGPRNAVIRAPTIIATIVGASAESPSTSSVPPRTTSAVSRVTSEIARLSGTARRAA